jgi:hypothetical protein
MRISYEYDVDGLRTWADLEHHLGDQWCEVRDRRTGLALSTHLDELLVDEPASGTAAQRRALHKAGFRRRDHGCWAWTAPEPADPPPPPGRSSTTMATSWAWLERDRALDRARSAQVLLVLREVYRAAPADLVVTVLDDDAAEEDWDDDDEDDDVSSGLDCAALEARFGPQRRTRSWPP